MPIDYKTAKRTRQPGVTRLPDGRLVIRASIRLPDGTRANQREIMPAGTTELEAAKARIGLTAKLRHPPPTPTPLRPTTDLTFELYARQWLALRVRHVTPSTAETYLAALERFIVPRLGHLRCTDINRQALEAWVVWAEGLRQGSGKPYAQDTMRQWFRALLTILRDMAADMDLQDPTRRVRAPERPEQQPIREQNTLTGDQMRSLLAACQEKFPQRLAEVAVMALTGARAGEVYGLKWDAVDLDAGRITIKRAVSRSELLERTKTKAHRVIPMHPDLKAILKAHKERQEVSDVECLAPGMVFLADNGKMRDPKSAKKLWGALCKAAGITQRVGPQVLRRSLNTLLLLEGVDRVTLRAILGHSSESMTQRYAGIGDAAKADAILKVGSATQEPPKRPKLVLLRGGSR